jgi:hypothetical protein
MLLALALQACQRDCCTRHRSPAKGHKVVHSSMVRVHCVLLPGYWNTACLTPSKHPGATNQEHADAATVVMQ